MVSPSEGEGSTVVAFDGAEFDEEADAPRDWSSRHEPDLIVEEVLG